MRGSSTKPKNGGILSYRKRTSGDERLLGRLDCVQAGSRRSKDLVGRMSTPILVHILIYQRIVFDYKKRSKLRYYMVQTWMSNEKSFDVRISVPKALGDKLCALGHQQKKTGVVRLGEPVVDVEKKPRVRRGRERKLKTWQEIQEEKAKEAELNGEHDVATLIRMGR